MAITKLPRNGIADDAINDSKIEDGTVAIAEVSGTITNAKLKDGDIANAKLSNSTFTIRGTSRALGDSFNLNVDFDWQSVVTGDTTMVAGQGYFVNTSSSAVTMTLPSSASAGDSVAIKDYAGTFATNNLTIGRNSHKIQGNSNNSTISTNRASLVLVYVDSTKGWLYSQESNVGDLQKSQFTEATGGTVTTSGDFKVHTFTGDGCFVVSQAGVPVGSDGGPASADYLVVAGGGGGGSNFYYAPADGQVRPGGGGGAGGYRASGFGPSPLQGSAVTLTATTFPITVGAGGAAGAPNPYANTGSRGSNSIFSTITSTGGGAGYSTGGKCRMPGGSGGGIISSDNATDFGPTGFCGAAGNTPPVSPPQGNNGGSIVPALRDAYPYEGAGGGGAGAVGGTASPGNSGDGGAGVPNQINGSNVTYAGGGGGYGVGGGTSPNRGVGGSGGGGNGTHPTSDAGAGTANTGGGGGGGGKIHGTPGSPGLGGAGGKGVVIIRYKFQ